MWARTFGIVLILLLTTPAFSQKTGSTYQYNSGFTYLRGLIVPQYAHGLHLTYGRPWGVELFWNQRALGRKEREKLFGYPQVGYSLTMIETDMVETGKISNAASYIDFYWLDTPDLKAYWRFGIGLTYAKKLYDPETNNLNNILSSRISYHVILRIGLQIPVAKQFYINPAISWNHTSNSSLSLPNNGINIASLNVGAAYRFGKAEWVHDSKPAPNDSINWIEKQGFGDVNTTELIRINHRLDVITLGSGNLNLKLINPNEVWLSMRALSNVTISGELSTLHVFVDKRVDGRFYAEDLTVRDVSIWHGGSNNLFVGPSDILRGTIKGSGDVFLFREPDRGVVVNEDGSGCIINQV